jgi:Ecdysteroid kinase-like family
MSAGSDKEARINAAFARDVAERRKVYDASEVPPFYEAITPEWFTAVMCREHPGAKVMSYLLDDTDNGTTNRRRIFLEYNQAGQNANLPRSVFCKASHDLANRLLLSASATFSEVNFYNRVRADLTIDAPKAYWAAYDPESWAAIVILQDMAHDVTFCNEDTVLSRPSVESQLTLLATLHGMFYNSARFSGDLYDLIPFHRRFHNLNLLHGIGVCAREGVETSEDLLPARFYGRREQVWEATLRAVDWQATQVATLTHSDVHLKNWYRRRDETMGLGDWQAVGPGHWARDVAYLLGTSLPVEQRRAQERELLDFYLDQATEKGMLVGSREQAFLQYRAQMLPALAFWTLTIRPSARMPDMQPRNTSRVFVHRLGTAADDLQSLDAVDEIAA